MIYLLTVRDHDRGNTVVPGRLITGEGRGTEADFARETELTFLIHGFNVSDSSGRASLQKLSQHLDPLLEGGLVAVLWPGDHWTGPLSYAFEGRDADDAAEQLGRYIVEHAARHTRLNFVAHSLGSRVAMETVKSIRTSGRRVDEVCLMAAAVDDDCLAHPKVYRNETAAVKRLAVLYSKEDEVLKYAYPAGDLLQAFLFWKDQRGGALGYHGPKPHPASGTALPDNIIKRRIPSARGADHGDYLPGRHFNREQRSAAGYIADVVGGEADPLYA